MSLALETKDGVFVLGGPSEGETTIAVPVCNPDLNSEEHGERILSGLDVEGIKINIRGKELKPSIKIYSLE